MLQDSLNKFAEAAVAELGSIPMQKLNRKAIPSHGKPWARMDHLTVGAKYQGFGSNTIRDEGFVIIALFFPNGEGTFEAYKNAESLRASLSNWRYNGFETHAGEIQEVRSTTDWYHLNITFPYRNN